MAMEQTASKQASLLGLPRELRLQIYQHVFTVDLNCRILDSWNHGHTKEHGSRSVPQLNKNARLVIPWLSLMLTCKDFAMELRSAMSEKVFTEDAQNTTWSLDLETERGGWGLGHTTWQRIPCAPGQLRVLEASYNALRGFRPWGDGGPSPITSSLYQTLNFLVHCGPRFNCKHQLQDAIHLGELRINVQSRDDADKTHNSDHCTPLSDRETNPETTLYALGSIVGQIVNTGILRGYVDMITVCSADQTLSWTPREVIGEGIPDYWDRYGFEWGEKAFPDR